MTENLNGELVPVRQQLEVDAEGMGRLAERAGTDCRAAGVHLTGEGGLLTALTRQVLQTALEVEKSQHLGYEKGDPAGRAIVGGANLRNGGRVPTLPNPR